MNQHAPEHGLLAMCEQYHSALASDYANFREARTLRVVDGIAVVPIFGALSKTGGWGGTSTMDLRLKLSQAAADASIKAILLQVESPGGFVSGTKETAGAIAEAGRKKPVWAHIEDLGASAAYWLAAQAAQIAANEMAVVGSIGTYAVVADLSGAAAQQGIRVHVVKAGAHKGDFTPGTEITAEQLGEYQRYIDAVNEHFLAGVAAGLKLPLAKVRALADGRSHLAAEAKKLGLIHAIEPLENTLARLRVHVGLGSATSPPRSATVKGNAVMSQASYHDLVAALPGADNDFVCSQLAANATVELARTAWMTEQNNRLAQARTAKPAATSTTTKPGVQPVNAGATAAVSSFQGDAIAQWEERLEAKMQRPGMTRAKAISQLTAEQPELHQAYIAEYNAKNGRTQRQLAN
ncbi:MAG TPA: S49 family peptidase [Pirellulaceae bacterium]|nr:S49 family peptidase [Pirellulaceae bacterium]